MKIEKYSSNLDETLFSSFVEVYAFETPQG